MCVKASCPGDIQLNPSAISQDMQYIPFGKSVAANFKGYGVISDKCTLCQIPPYTAQLCKCPFGGLFFGWIIFAKVVFKSLCKYGRPAVFLWRNFEI